MIYLQIGLYAEGSSDYHLLLPLLARLTAELVERYPGTSRTRNPLTRALE